MKFGRFTAIVSRVLALSVAMSAVGFTTGCGDSVPTEAKVDEAKDRKVQDAMKNFMATKKANPSGASKK